MTAPTTRRAALGALASASALALPAVSSSAALPTGDAELLALQPEIEEADRLDKAAIAALSRLEDAYNETMPPEPIPESVKLTALPTTIENDGLTAGERAMAGVKHVRKLYDERDSRYDEAMRAWENECARLAAECGLTAADDHASEANKRVNSLRDKVAATRATTLAGLKFKAKYASEHYPPDDWAEEVMASITEDLLAMDGEAT
jgi:hypothetical protein